MPRSPKPDDTTLRCRENDAEVQLGNYLGVGVSVDADLCDVAASHDDGPVLGADGELK